MQSITTMNRHLSFSGLLEPHKNTYTQRQEKLSNLVREMANTTCPDDKKGRSYMDYYKDEFGVDLYIKPDKEKNAIDLYGYNKKENSFDIIKRYKKGIKPKETDFKNFTYFLKEEIEERFEKILTYGIVWAMLIGAGIAGSQKQEELPAENNHKIELVDNNIKQLEVSDTIIKSDFGGFGYDMVSDD